MRGTAGLGRERPLTRNYLAAAVAREARTFGGRLEPVSDTNMGATYSRAAVSALFATARTHSFESVDMRNLAHLLDGAMRVAGADAATVTIHNRDLKTMNTHLMRANSARARSRQLRQGRLPSALSQAEAAGYMRLLRDLI